MNNLISIAEGLCADSGGQHSGVSPELRPQNLLQHFKCPVVPYSLTSPKNHRSNQQRQL